MNPDDGSQLRPISSQQRNWLQAEVDAWQESDLVAPHQAAAILQQYETPLAHSVQRWNLFLVTLLGLAAVLFGAAAFLLVGFNWELLPSAAKLAIIICVLGFTYGLAFYRRLKLRQDLVANVVFLLGGLFYGAGIWLVAQVFHMSAHYPDGFFWWAAGLLPLALLLDTVLLHVLLATVLGLWISTEVLHFGHLGSILFGFRWNWLPNGVYLAPLMMAPGLWWSYRRSSFWGVAMGW